MSAPLRILHVLGSLGRGGVETWLMNTLRHLDPDKYRFDFLLHLNNITEFEREAQERGSHIFRIASRYNVPLYRKELRNILRDHQYRVIHAHTFRFSGHLVRIAAQLNVPVRIAHGHTGEAGASGFLRSIYNTLMHRWLWKYSTHGFGCSSFALKHLLGPEALQDQRFRVLPFGLDFSRYLSLPSRVEAKEALGIHPSRVVIGHVGRMIPIKNQAKLLQAFALLLKNNPQLNPHLVMVGDGALRSDLEQLAKELNLGDACHFVGLQLDVPAYLAAMDVACTPSFREGLGVVVVEAQAAGVPSVISSNIPQEVDVLSDLVARVDPEASAETWAQALRAKLQTPPLEPA
ncbi:MAG: glycosyltransferase, partial [Myxococcota bacterium]